MTTEPAAPKLLVINAKGDTAELVADALGRVYTHSKGGWPEPTEAAATPLTEEPMVFKGLRNAAISGADTFAVHISTIKTTVEYVDALQAELAAKEAELETLLKITIELRDNTYCDNYFHSKSEYHQSSRCPVEDRFDAAIDAARNNKGKT